MSIPEQQLETWSHQGSISQSANTYQSVKSVLESPDSPYYQKSFVVFLQGSYGNDTNIRTESDVDIVIRLDSTYYSNQEALSAFERQTFQASTTTATYGLEEFKAQVIQHLRSVYGTDVTVGEKAVQIAPRNGRRKTDVIIATQFRKFLAYPSDAGQRYIEGIRFKTRNNIEIINYPKLHSENLTAKHQASNGRLKPLVRVLKNMRREMIDRKYIEEGAAPSYFIEGLLYNVPPHKFENSLAGSFVNAFNWLLEANRDDFLCANEQYYLCHPTSHVTWRAEKRDAFINAAIRLWNNWR